MSKASDDIQQGGALFQASEIEPMALFLDAPVAIVIDASASKSLANLQQMLDDPSRRPNQEK